MDLKYKVSTILLVVIGGLFGSYYFFVSNDLRQDSLSVSTLVTILNDSTNLGILPYGSKDHSSFCLKNVGSQPLFIYTVKTSCGCTAVRFDKKPIPPGGITTVALEYKPNSLGYFHKTADVVCNIPEGFVRLSISGTVVEN